MKVRFNINPVPASRPRVSKYGTYYGKKYKAFRSEMQSLVPNALPKRWKPISGAISVSLGLYCHTPKAPTNPYPIGDIDNYAKAVLDACNGLVWVDDVQITELCLSKQYSDDPHIILEVQSV